MCHQCVPTVHVQSGFFRKYYDSIGLFWCCLPVYSYATFKMQLSQWLFSLWVTIQFHSKLQENCCRINVGFRISGKHLHFIIIQWWAVSDNSPKKTVFFYCRLHHIVVTNGAWFLDAIVTSCLNLINIYMIWFIVFYSTQAEFESYTVDKWNFFKYLRIVKCSTA